MESCLWFSFDKNILLGPTKRLVWTWTNGSCDGSKSAMLQDNVIIEMYTSTFRTRHTNMFECMKVNFTQMEWWLKCGTKWNKCPISRKNCGLNWYRLSRWKCFFLFPSTRFVPSVDGKWGTANENGSFNGLIGMIQREEAYIGIMAFTQTDQRSLVADHTMPLGYYS